MYHSLFGSFLYAFNNIVSASIYFFSAINLFILINVVFVLFIDFGILFFISF
ncbi:hypothetical protein HOG21_03165 [bacterium]|nr:hypothetical protein [bacterium]